MIIVGVDAHKRTHTCVAIDGRGQRLGEKTVQATSAGNASALKWALLKFGPELKWAIEDVRTVFGRLEQELMSAGQPVVRVPTKLMARTRASARTRGKSDSIDATEIARAALREPDLPVAQHDPVSRDFRLLTERRDVLVEQRTATTNRVQWRIHVLDPLRSRNLKPLMYAKNREPVAAWLAELPGPTPPDQSTQAVAARRRRGRSLQILLRMSHDAMLATLSINHPAAGDILPAYLHRHRSATVSK